LDIFSERGRGLPAYASFFIQHKMRRLEAHDHVKYLFYLVVRVQKKDAWTDTLIMITAVIMIKVVCPMLLAGIYGGACVDAELRGFPVE
jgi:hypothetical protein